MPQPGLTGGRTPIDSFQPSQMPMQAQTGGMDPYSQMNGLQGMARPMRYNDEFNPQNVNAQNMRAQQQNNPLSGFLSSMQANPYWR